MICASSNIAAVHGRVAELVGGLGTRIFQRRSPRRTRLTLLNKNVQQKQALQLLPPGGIDLQPPFVNKTTLTLNIS